MADTTETTAAGSLKCVVVTPEKMLLEQEAEFITLPLFDGEIGIAPLHSPMIGRLGYGEMRLQRADKQTERYYLDGGFVQVADNVVSVLTNRAIAASELDLAEAEKMVSDAIAMKVSTEDEFAVRDRRVEQGRAQGRLARKSRS